MFYTTKSPILSAILFACCILQLSNAHASHAPTKKGFFANLAEKAALKIAVSSGKKAVHGAVNYVTSADGVKDMAAACMLLAALTLIHKLGHSAAKKLLFDSPIDMSNGCAQGDIIHRPHSHLKMIAADLSGPIVGSLASYLAFLQLQKHQGLYITKAASLYAIFGNILHSWETHQDYANIWQEIKSFFV